MKPVAWNTMSPSPIVRPSRTMIEYSSRVSLLQLPSLWSMMYATWLPSSSRPPAPIEYLPVPTKSARVLIAFGEQGPGGTTVHEITCASQLCQLKRISRPSRYTCSHELPVGPPPSCSGLELPPNVLCLWPFRPVSGSSFMQPPPVRRHVPSGAHPVGSQLSAVIAASVVVCPPPSLKHGEVNVPETFARFSEDPEQFASLAMSKAIVQAAPGARVNPGKTSCPFWIAGSPVPHWVARFPAYVKPAGRSSVTTTSSGVGPVLLTPSEIRALSPGH